MDGIVTTRDGVGLAWDGSGAGPTVLLVHGLGLNRRRWQAQMDALAAAGFRAVRFDLRGFGDSDMPPAPYDMATLTDDVEAVADALGLDEFHLVGHSLGGMIAQRFTLDHPGRVRTLTVASTTAHNGRRATAFANAMARLSAEGFDAGVSDPQVRMVIEGVLTQALGDGAPPVEHFRRGLEEPNLAHAYAWAATADFSVKDELPRLPCPLLVLHGTADPLIPFVVGQYIHWVVPGSGWVPLEGAGHSIQVERAQEFSLALVGFLTSAT